MRILAHLSHRLPWLSLLLLWAVTLLVFADVRGHEFVHFDDNVNIYNNPHVQGLTVDNLVWMFTDTEYARRYMPLGWLSFALDYQLFGLNPHAYHLGNLLLHLLNVSLLFLILRQLLTRAGVGNQASHNERIVILCATCASLFWAVNPLRVENVAWASSRIYCLAFSFLALALWSWLRAQDPALPEKRRRVFSRWSLVAYAASLLTYPLALFAPLVLVAFEIFPLRRLTTRLKDWVTPAAWPVWRDKLPFLALGGLVLGITFLSLMQMESRSRPVTLEEFPLLSRVMQAFYIWGYYAWKPWAPYDLAISYGTLHAFDPLAPRFLISAIAVLGGSAMMFWKRRAWPAACALWFCHLGLLIPVLGLTEYPHSPYDRYSYLPGIVWSIALAFFLQAMWNQKRELWGYLTTAGVTATALLFAAPAWQQVQVWRDTIPLYQNLLGSLGDQAGRSRFDHVLAVHYLRAGLTNEAIRSLENAIHYESIRTDRHLYSEGVLVQSHLRLGDVMAELGRIREALDHYQSAIQADPTRDDAVMRSGLMLARMQRPEAAERWLREAIRMNPANDQAQQALISLALNQTNSPPLSTSEKSPAVTE